MTEKVTPTPLYVGTQNDGIYIIDQKPRPAPMDYVRPGGTTRVIATMKDNDGQAGADADLFVAASNACKLVSHDNPLAVAEAIGEMVELLGEAERGELNVAHRARALLTRIGKLK